MSFRFWSTPASPSASDPDEAMTSVSRSSQGLVVIATAAFVLACGAALFHLASALWGAPLDGDAPEVAALLDPADVTVSDLDGPAVDHGAVEVMATVRVQTDDADDGRGGAFRMWAVVESLGAGAAAVVLWLLRGLFLSLRRGHPFVADNVRRLRVIGMVLIVVPAVMPLLSGIARDQLILRTELADLVHPWFEVSFLPSIIGMGILALAEVWRVGIAMRDELELTV